MRRSVSVNATKEGVVRFPVWQVGLALVLGGNLKNPKTSNFDNHNNRKKQNM